MEIVHQIFQEFEPTLMEKVMAVVDFKKLERGALFLKEGQISNQIAFVMEGALQSFFCKDGEEITTYLAGPGKVTVSLSSFLNNIPSKENIRALTETSIIVFHKTDIDKLKEENPDFKQFYIETLEHQITCIEESRFDLITLSSVERYSKLLKDELSILQQFPVKYLANTLGITERQMSRIRKKIFDK